MALETNDVGAINFGGGGDAGYYGWNLNETVRFNNISRTVGAEGRDGLHVCQRHHGGWGGQPRHVFGPEEESDCAWATWSIYLDGGAPPSGGTAGVHIYSNIIDGSTSGGVFVNGGGNVTITNNIILDGTGSQILIYSYPRPSKWGCPGTTIERNIMSFTATASDAQRSGWSVGPVRAYGGFYMSPNEHPAGTCPINSTINAADANVFWNPVLGKAALAARGLFGSVGV